MLIVVIGLLAVGTYGLRLSGVLLHDRLKLPAAVARVLPLAAVALLGALAVNAAVTQGRGLARGAARAPPWAAVPRLGGRAVPAALTEGGGFAGWARPAGVLAGMVAALCRLPFVAVVVIAAGTAALLRACGVA